MGYSITNIKYIKYSGLGMDSNHFFMIFGQCWTIWDKTRKMSGAKQPTFLKKQFSYESSGQTPKLKSFVYGSSNHDLFKKKVDSIGKLHSSSRILVGTLFFI